MDEATVELMPERAAGEGSVGGAPASFESFFREEQASLYRALWLLTRNGHEAEELMQDAFLRLWERWERVGSLEDPVGYLYRTAMNLFRSRLRRAAVAVRRAVGHLPARDPLGEVEEREAVARALGALTRRQRAAVVLTDLLGFTSDEAGAALGISGSTVRVLTSRARATLEKELGDRDG
jgi:RNA polymerase sigma-70 factor, ECF subfamily